MQIPSSIAPQIAVPALWFYAENDEYIGPRAQKLWFESFRSAGGRGELVVVPPFPERILAEFSRGGYRRHCRIIELEIT